MTQKNEVNFWQKIVAILLAIFVVLSTIAVVLFVQYNKKEKAIDKEEETSQVQNTKPNKGNTPPANLVPPEKRRTVKFGSYPKTKIIDPDVIKTLEKQNLEWHEMDEHHKYMKYADVSFPNGEKYRAIQLVSQRTDWISSESELEGREYIEVGKTYWFKYEELKWEILDEKTGLAICTTVIDGQPAAKADNFGRNTDYIYNWLNNNFYNTAFSEEDKKNINVCKTDSKDYNVVLLESDKFTSAKFKPGEESDCEYTNYAECMGITSRKSGKACWWLKNLDGPVFADVNDLANGNDPTLSAGVRPVIYIPGIKK